MTDRIPQSDNWPSLPPRITDLAGAKFGRLSVLHFAGMNRHHHSMWCCECECGNFTRVEGGALLGRKNGHDTVSCGCQRSDPAVRKAARLRMPAKQRAQICTKMREAVKRRVQPYAMSLDRAADVMGESPDRVRALCQDGTLGSKLKNGVLWVSSQDVSDFLATNKPAKKCKTREKVLAHSRSQAQIALLTRKRHKKPDRNIRHYGKRKGSGKCPRCGKPCEERKVKSTGKLKRYTYCRDCRKQRQG